MQEGAYEKWRDRLFEALVAATGRPGRPLYLFVDRDDLAEVSGIAHPHAALQSFTEAFCDRYGRREPFAAEFQLSQRFDHGSDATPPYFLALVMSVLAVTEEPLGAAHGVYRQQNALLGRPQVPAAPPGYGTHVPALWEAWNRWLRVGGSRYGLPTARSHSHWTHQGWARSQGLFRHQDRLLVQDWFLDRGLLPGDTLQRSRLLLEFESWLRFHQRSGGALLAKVGDEAARDVLADLLECELAAWSGVVASGPGRRRPRGLLVFDDWVRQFSLAFEPSPDLFGHTITVDGYEQVLDDTTGLITVPSALPVHELLTGGEEVRLSDDLMLRGGGEPVYLFSDSVEAQGLLQDRGPQLGRAYRLLLQVTSRARTELAIRSAGATGYTVEPGPVDGWVWMRGVTFVRPVEPDYFDVLGASSPVAPPRARLVGGLRVVGTTYLTGGCPDVQLADGSDVPHVQVDGEPFVDETPDDWVVSLPGDRLLGGQEHRVVVRDDVLRFRLEDEITLWPRSPRYGHRIERVDGTASVFNSSAGPLDDGEGVLGAEVGHTIGEQPCLVRARPGSEVMVLTEQGLLVQVWDHPRWLEEATLVPFAVDVRRALRGVSGEPAFMVVRSPSGSRLNLVEVPESVSAAPGNPQVHDRPDVLPSLMSGRYTAGRIDKQRLSRALTAAMSRYKGLATARPVPRPAPAGTPRLAVPTEEARNPYDLLLRWLSELEPGSASSAAFRDSWGWVARQHGWGDGSDWRLALFKLQTLGHVEVDYDRSRVGVAPAVANVVGRGLGFAVLCGSRPGSLLRQLSESQPRLPAVAAAADHWVVHMRTQPGEDGRPHGPVALYLEWDPEQQRTVEDGLAALGIKVAYDAGTMLLNLLPGLQRRLELARAFDVPPSDHAVVKTGAKASWEPTRSTTVRGVYRFATRRGPVFAWREGPSSALTEIDRRLAPYLLLADQGRPGRELLHYVNTRSTLLVSRDASLTPLLARSLVLRTGLLPRPLEGPHNVFSDRYLEYPNIDPQMAERVADLLRQPLGYLSKKAAD